MVSVRFEYVYSDYGTERAMTMFIDDKKIMSADPFWPAGIPVSKKARARRMKECEVMLWNKYVDGGWETAPAGTQFQLNMEVI